MKSLFLKGHVCACLCVVLVLIQGEKGADACGQTLPFPRHKLRWTCGLHEMGGSLSILQIPSLLRALWLEFQEEQIP